jgi:hypothetical protein
MWSDGPVVPAKLRARPEERGTTTWIAGFDWDGARDLIACRSQWTLAVMPATGLGALTGRDAKVLQSLADELRGLRSKEPGGLSRERGWRKRWRAGTGANCWRSIRTNSERLVSCAQRLALTGRIYVIVRAFDLKG